MVTDPKKKLWDYDCYIYDYVMLHRGDISTRIFLNNKDKYHYDSFIFGSSRSCSHTARAWKKYLPSGSVPFSFGSWNETIEGIYKRMELIDQSNVALRNVFIILDEDYSFVQSPQNNLQGDHYLISGQSKWKYYLSDFKDYLSQPILIISSIDYGLFKKQRFYMENFVGQTKDDVDPISNDWGVDETPVKKNDYEKVMSNFYPRPRIQKYAISKIDHQKLIILNKMANLFKKHNTDYRIIIAPIYNQIKLNPDDMSHLQNIFGKQHIYDYSGINALTDDIYNFATDVKHYRKSVGNIIFGEVYCSKK